MKTSKLLTFVLSISTAFAVLTSSIAAPILIRPFYYAQIDALHLVERTGWSKEIIRKAYDQVLDFCILGTEFSTGQLQWSESGRDHFLDVAALFRLNFWLLWMSMIAIIFTLLIARLKKLSFWCPLGRGPFFWSGIGLSSLFLLISALVVSNFSQAFVIFHQLFFPGKDNWILNHYTDQIILILPEEFFRNCAIFIVGLLLLCCSGLIAFDLLKRPDRHNPPGKE